MATSPSRRVIVPARARAGEVIEIRTLIQHAMITGYTRDAGGVAVPRNIIERVVVTYDGEEIFSADLGPGIAANPYLAFTTVATRSGEIVFTWIEDTGEKHEERRSLQVT